MFWRSCWLVLFGFLLAACTAVSPETIPTTIPTASPIPPTSTVKATAVPEAPVIEIPISKPFSKDKSEISGLAWYGENLIFLPQYPSRFDNHLFYLPKQDILAFLDGKLAGPLTPQQIPFSAPDIHTLKGYEGLEAIAFLDNQIFVTSETEGGDPMLGYLIAGEIEPDLSAVRLDTAVLTPIQPPADISNYSDETLMVDGDRLLTIYEANGRNVNPNPQAHQFDMGLEPSGTLPFPNIEYRITDATAVDENDRFWAINYLFPGNLKKLDPAEDMLRAEYGAGPSHADSQIVERLVEFQIETDGIRLIEAPPIQLALLADDTARNWEGIVRLDENNGFLIVTDEHPTTILAFVPKP